MANSLRDQLVRAGLADEKRARQVEKDKRTGAKKVRRGQAKADDAAVRERERARAEKAERDRRLEAERKEARRRKEAAAQIRQMIRDHRLEGGGEVSYQFTEGAKVRRIWVTPEQQSGLARGGIAVVAFGKGYELVPAETAEKIRERDPAVVLVHNTAEPGGDDPYGDYPVPDDLMW